MTSTPDAPAVAVPASTVVVFSDLLCPFAYVALHRFRAARARAGLDGVLHVDHHVFPLELFNGPHSRPGTDTEAVGLGQIEPSAGFRVWGAPDWTYPSTVLLAAEAVLAAKRQSLAASEALDAALRRAFWFDSLPIGHRGTILDIAGAVGGLDAEALAADLDHGVARAALTDDYRVARTGAVATSPHLFLPDGTSLANPGIEVRWEGPWASGYPIVEADDPGIWEVLLARAVAA